MKIPFWASVLTITGVVILCALGTWQLQRLAWKTDLIEKLARAYNADPVSFSPDINLSSQNFVRIIARGTFLHDKAVKISPRTHDGTPGYHVLTPLKTEGGAILMVNRGWIPLNLESFEKPAGFVDVEGIARPVPTPNIFVPANNPAADQWYRAIPDEIAQAKGLSNVYQGVLYSESSNTAYPLTAATQPQLNNNHLHYALFWFAMAGVLVLIYVLRFLQR